MRRLTDCVYRCVAGQPLYPTEESLFGAVGAEDYAAAFLDSLPLPSADHALTLWLPLGVGAHVDHQIARDWGLRLQAGLPSPWSLRWYAEYPYFTEQRGISLALADMDTPLVERHTRLHEADMAARLGAMAHYESQISTFWRDLDDMAASTRRAARMPSSGSLVERYWMTKSERENNI